MLVKIKKRWTDRRVLKKVSRVFRMWYGITTNIVSAPYLPKDITQSMFKVLADDMKDFIKTELKYVSVENEKNAKIAAILFEQYDDENLVLGFQIFVQQEDEWYTKVGKEQVLKKVESLKLTDKVEYNSISPEWIENVDKATDIHEIGRSTMKSVNPRRTEILYFA